MKIAITGILGRLGSASARLLLEAGHTIVGTDLRFQQGLPYPLHVIDLRHRENAYGFLEGVDVLVHLANHTHANAADAQKVFTENTTMNMHAFQAAMEHGVGKIVYASSIQALTGDQKNRRFLPSGPSPEIHLPYLPLDGNVPALPGNSYALSKVVGEQMLEYFSRIGGMATAGVRFPMLILEEWIPHMKRGRSSWGNPAEGFAFLCLKDAARFVRALVETDWTGHQIYFPAQRENMVGLPVRELVEEYFANVPLRQPLESLESLVDISVITRETGWEPEPFVFPEPTGSS